MYVFTKQDLVKARESGISHCPNSNFSLDSGILDVRSCLNRGIKVSLGTDVAGGYSSSILDAIRQTIIASKSLQFMHEELARREAALLPLKGVGTADHANDDTGAHTDASASDSSGTASAAQTVAVTERKALSVEESFYLATMGGARVMNLDQKVGNFLVGKQLDALVIDMGEKDLDVTASMMGHGCSDTACMHSSGDGDGGMGGGHVCPMDLNSYENVYEAFQKFIFLADDRNIQRVYINGRLVHKLK